MSRDPLYIHYTYLIHTLAVLLKESKAKEGVSKSGTDRGATAKLGMCFIDNYICIYLLIKWLKTMHFLHIGGGVWTPSAGSITKP